MDWALISSLLLIAWSVYMFILAIWVILQKRPPEATLGWILALSMIPYVGFLVFYLVGPKRLQRYQSHHDDKLSAAFKEDIETLKKRATNMPQKMHQLSVLGINTCDFYPCTAQEVELLPSGAAAFGAIFAAIEQAKHHIHLEYYIYENDYTGTRLRDLLIKKLQEGVEVRLLIDALGSKNARASFIKPFIEAGGEFARFNDSRIGRRWRTVLNYRTHRKIVVCDGKIGFTGGVKITDEEDTRRCESAYHDMHVRVTGNIVA